MLWTYIVVESLRLAAVVARLPALGRGAVQVPEHAANISVSSQHIFSFRRQ